MNEPTVGLMMDLRERLVRIETKMDTSAEQHKTLNARVDANEVRIDEIEAAQDQLKTTVKVVSWIGGAVITIITLLGDHGSRLFHS